ncbi:unnamed protein product [Phyllotreta striolata]|uniref:PID domain-containing protein n=1 Tax=Phyllotreta striolata TaxID=444603 RepID=A0A9N9TQA4_PHYSR|nr:unnamed protein product [Phyllotreta striolata]
MALKLRKDIKKSSYYVWFLGAKESKGLRGTEYIIPVIKHLEEREKDIEPFKVTLQVSHKGLKIIQNIVSQNQKNSKPKNETIKHFIPHNTITCVYQQDDVIACILLLFNPVTKCPLHVHAYRCDSLETATLLKNQLQILIERPDNQKKFTEIESRLKPQKELKKVDSSIGSDTGTSTRESESSEERYAVESTRVTTLYDSVAAELRAKLGKKSSPILLPPRDYDTVHRNKGNLTGIELRRCLNANIVGQNVKGRRLESSGGSSGIGSDHPPSPESPDAPDSRFNTLDNQSTSDEDWNGDTAESTVYLMHQPAQIHTPKPPRDKSPDSHQRYSRYVEPHSPKFENSGYKSARDGSQKFMEKPITKYTENKYIERQRSLEKDKFSSNKFAERTRSLEKEKFMRHYDHEGRSGSLEKNEKYGDNRYYYQGDEEPDKFNRYFESDRYPEKSRQATDDYHARKDKPKPTKYFDDADFEENVRYKNKPDFERGKPRFTYEEEEEYFDNRPMPKIRQRYPPDELKMFKDNGSKSLTRSSPDDSRYYPEPEIKARPTSHPIQKDHFKHPSRSDREEKSTRSQDYYEEPRNNGIFRATTPSSDDIKAPRDRFKDAKEKFLMMERERLENERRRPEPPISPTNVKEKPFNKRYSDGFANGRDRFFNDHRAHLEDPKPTPAPRHFPEEIRYRDPEVRLRERDPSRDRYRPSDKYDPKRRSMFSLIEEEHRKNSSEIAKELKRRSYMDGGNYDEEDDRSNRERHFQDLPEADRFLDGYSKSNGELAEKMGDSKYIKNQKQGKGSAGYRHSYAEPMLRMEKNGKKYFPEILHRTNSSVGNSGRVGIASVHPY